MQDYERGRKDSEINDLFILRATLWKVFSAEVPGVCRLDFANQIGQNIWGWSFLIC